MSRTLNVFLNNFSCIQKVTLLKFSLMISLCVISDGEIGPTFHLIEQVDSEKRKKTSIVT